MVKAVEGGPNHRPATGVNRRDEVLCKSRLAGSVHPVDGDTNRMRPLDVHDAMSEFV
jgi:hypothetical protein